MDVLDEHVHSRTTTAADPLAAALAPEFDKLILDWGVQNATWIQLHINLAQALANAFQIDLQFNGIVDELMLVFAKIAPDLKDPIRFNYLKGEQASVLKEPILAGQLEKMAVWPQSMLNSSHQELKDIGAKLAPLVPIGVAAEDAMAKAEQAIRDFENVGGWAQHLAMSNTTRTAAHGTLSDIPYQNQALKLPAGYADLFFLHDTSRRGSSKPRSSKSLTEEIAALNEKAAALDPLLKAAVAREKKEADDAAEREVKLKDLAKVEQDEKDAKAKKKALKKELKKKK
jgi:hypothetical protein